MNITIEIECILLWSFNYPPDYNKVWNIFMYWLHSIKKSSKCKLIIYMNITIILGTWHLNTGSKETTLHKQHFSPDIMLVKRLLKSPTDF